ncbi:MAG TPA: DoxX family protein [Vicinamibacterales bacterium]|jgi:putative oxidoreductase
MSRLLEPTLFTAMRIVFGLLFLMHGMQKLFGVLGGTAAGPTTMLGVAGIIETIGGPLIMIGLLTRATAFICAGEMAAAYFLVHQPRAAWPIQNAGEPAVLFCFAFLYFAVRGGGTWSLDAARPAAADRRRV